MENRMQINGVWYVKDFCQDDKVPNGSGHFNSKDTTKAISCTWEYNDWCFEASKLFRDSDLPCNFSLEDCYESLDIKITDKRLKGRENWIEEFCDNENWFLGIYNDDPESMPDALEMFDPQGLAEFKAFIGYLINKGWLKNKK